jgi:hypothetical protein
MSQMTPNSLSSMINLEQVQNVLKGCFSGVRICLSRTRNCIKVETQKIVSGFTTHLFVSVSFFSRYGLLHYGSNSIQ